MPNRTTRSVYSVAGKRSGSKGITLPKDWTEKFPECSRVHIIYNDIILIFHEDQAKQVERIFEDVIQQTIRQTLNKGSEPSEPSEETG